MKKRLLSFYVAAGVLHIKQLQKHAVLSESMPGVCYYLLIWWPTLPGGYHYHFPVMKMTHCVGGPGFLFDAWSGACWCGLLFHRVWPSLLKFSNQHFPYQLWSKAQYFGQIASNNAKYSQLQMWDLLVFLVIYDSKLDVFGLDHWLDKTKKLEVINFTINLN